MINLHFDQEGVKPILVNCVLGGFVLVELAVVVYLINLSIAVHS